jgi:hypothetical protein
VTTLVALCSPEISRLPISIGAIYAHPIFRWPLVLASGYGKLPVKGGENYRTIIVADDNRYTNKVLSLIISI